MSGRKGILYARKMPLACTTLFLLWFKDVYVKCNSSYRDGGTSAKLLANVQKIRCSSTMVYEVDWQSACTVHLFYLHLFG